MRRLLFFVGCLLLTMTLFAQQPLVRFYTGNGDAIDYKVEDIEQIIFVNRTDDMIMEVFLENAGEDLYPARAISRFGFTTDSIGRQMLTAHIFDQPRHFPLHAIDSIVFSRLEPKIVENITVVDSLSRDDLLAVEENAVVFRAGSALASGIINDWYIVSEPVPQAPYGFLRKVTGITIQGDQLIAATEEASIFDVVEEGIISFQMEIEAADLDTLMKWNVPVPANSLPDKSMSLTFKYDLYKKIELSGTLTFTSVADFCLIIRRFTPEYLLIQNFSDGSLDVKISREFKADAIKYEGSLNEMLGIPNYYLPYQVIWLGKIPVVLTSFINVAIKVDVAFKAEVSVGVKVKQSTFWGLEYNAHREPEKWTDISQPFRMSYKYSPPDLSLGGSLKHSLGPKLNQSFYGVHTAFNSHAGVYAYLELEFDIKNKPHWKLSAGAETDAGIESKRFEDLEYEYPWSLKGTRVLAQALDLISKVTPDAAAIGDTITISGEGFGDSQEASFVGFKFGESLLPVDVLRATDILSWENEKIRLIVPPGFDLSNVKDELKIDLLVNTGGYWNNIWKFRLLVGPIIESFSPDTLVIGKELVIKGKLFGEERMNSTVSFGGIEATEYLAWSDTEIVLKVPEGIEDGMLTVEVDERTSNEVPYVVAVPLITSIYPEDVFPGTELIVRGKYFGETQNNSFVSFNGVNATRYTEWSDTKIMLTVPPGIENGQLWVEVSGKISNKVTYSIRKIEVIIMPPRFTIYELQPGVTEVMHEFEAYALPDSAYRYTWHFDDGQTFSEIVQKGEKSKVSHTYVGIKGGDVFYPWVELFGLSGEFLARDGIEISFTGDNEEPYLGPNSFNLELVHDVYQGVVEDNVKQMLTYKISGKVTSSEEVKIKKIKPNSPGLRELLIIKNRTQKIEIEAKLLTYITPVEARSPADSDGSYYLYSYTNPAFWITHHTTDWYILPEDTFNIEIDIEGYKIQVSAMYDHTVKICDATGECEIEDSWLSQTGDFVIHVVYDEVGHGFDLEDDD